MRHQLRATIPREHTFVVHAINAPHSLARFEITQIPNMFPDDERFGSKQQDILLDHLRLILLAEHFGRLRMMAGYSIRTKLGDDNRLAELLMDRIKLVG